MSAANSARWAKTYLMPEEQLPASLAAQYSAAGNGLQILDTFVKVARELLSGWPGEAQLHLVRAALTPRQRPDACHPLC